MMQQAALVVAGQVFGEAHPIGADEATQDADGVHRGNGRCGGAAGEECRSR